MKNLLLAIAGMIALVAAGYVTAASVVPSSAQPDEVKLVRPDSGSIQINLNRCGTRDGTINVATGGGIILITHGNGSCTVVGPSALAKACAERIRRLQTTGSTSGGCPIPL